MVLLYCHSAPLALHRKCGLYSTMGPKWDNNQFQLYMCRIYWHSMMSTLHNIQHNHFSKMYILCQSGRAVKLEERDRK